MRKTGTISLPPPGAKAAPNKKDLGGKKNILIDPKDRKMAPKTFHSFKDMPIVTDPYDAPPAKNQVVSKHRMDFEEDFQASRVPVPKRDYETYASRTYGAHKACWESHPALVMPGTKYEIYGGSCSTPIIRDADVYIGFDPSMKRTSRCWPWMPGDEVYMHIRDRDIPEVPEFKGLVDWTWARLVAGDVVHAGCIGGHGRTGLFLAALVARHTDVVDAITYVREHYCQKAVESNSQVEFLVKHFGVTRVSQYDKFHR